MVLGEEQTEDDAEKEDEGKQDEEQGSDSEDKEAGLVDCFPRACYTRYVAFSELIYIYVQRRHNHAEVVCSFVWPHTQCLDL